MIQPDPATAGTTSTETEVGSVFVSNYPPFSFWSADGASDAVTALAAPAKPDTDLGLYLHIPFCRKRCKFCYFRVYTDKNYDEIGSYLDALSTEVELLSKKPAIAGRPLRFVYFGGGTPSYISAKQLRQLATRLQAAIPWSGAEEITFECEPGTLTHAKLEAIREIGVTRLSLGVENFNDDILRENGRAHVSQEIYRCLPWIEELGFEQLNIDLIAGMVGETWKKWKVSVARTLELSPDSVTVYQMELPFNTRYSKHLQEGELGVPLADWEMKRQWHDYAFEELAKAGYEISSAYTMVKDRDACNFVYRDGVWHGCDLLGTGVASFSHVGGVHFQNADGWGEYLAHARRGESAIARGWPTTAHQRLTREMILQLKLGRIEASYFQDKFGVDILSEFAPALQDLEDRGMLSRRDGVVELSRDGLLRVDTLLPAFYAPEHRNARYT